MPPFPSLTKDWHSKPYPAIDPARSELSAKGKVVAVTGGGGSIGAASALAFARAGATSVAIIGRREGPLATAKKMIEGQVPGAKVQTVQGDVASADSIASALSQAAQSGGGTGKIDVLVAGAGYLPRFESIAGADVAEWWAGYEINVLGQLNTARALLPLAAAGAVVVYISTGPVHMPAMPSASGYITSKLAGTKVWETFGAENAGVEVVHVHPGVVYSEINVKSGITAVDDANLSGQFCLWAASDEAKFLREGNPGRMLWCNWDVEELKSRKDELSKPSSLVITLNGWPFGQESNMDALSF